ncbi:MAG: hypothetical protein ACR2JF_17540 [Iamia sp.]
MLNRSYQVERPAAAGSPRAFACGGAALAGADGTFDRGWTITPSTMPVSVAKHDSTPALRPEEAVPR